ncbi:MAG TPA: hypothetical protein VGM67_16850 [Gemmatimonadaceae bacterium]
MAVASRASAQTSPQPALIPIANRSYIGINPLGVPFDIFSVEGETGVAQGITLGAVGSYTDVNHDRWESADFKFRYYPGDVVLRGFSLGGTVGYLDYSTPRCCTPGGTTVRQSVSTPTVGVIADYNFMLGMDHRFIVGTGVGAKRVLASEDDRNRVGLDRAYFTGRFTIGIAF